MDPDRAITELNIDGEFDDEAREKYPAVVRLMEDVLDHGEVHAIFEDQSQYVEVRQGTATFDFKGEVIVLDNGITEHSFAMDHLSNWEKPMNVFEEGAD